MMMQIVGNPASCWELTAHASRTLVALGYHTRTSVDAVDEYDEEILAAIAWCSHFDSCMSLLLMRPRSLPPMSIKVTSLIKSDPLNPMSVFEMITMQMIPIHERILDLTLDSGTKKAQTSIKEEVGQLRIQMANIYSLMQRVRNYTSKHKLWHTDNVRIVQQLFWSPLWTYFCIGSVLSSSTSPP
jgi:hypothetical protein